MLQLRRLTMLAMCGLLLAMCAACKPTMQKMDLTVTVDSELADRPPFVVHIIGVSEADKEGHFEGVQYFQWFEPGNTTRKESENEKLVAVLNFGKGHPSQQTIASRDEIWTRWEKQRSAWYLITYVDLRPAEGQDPKVRKFVLPLSSDRWDTSRVRIEIKPSRIISTPAPLTEKK